MKKALSTFLLFSLCFSLFAQDSTIAFASEFIKKQNYAGAEHYLDSILHKKPKSVDALMMKGNVLLNYTWLNTGHTYFDAEAAESVFDTAAINPNLFVPIIPKDTSELIEKLWKQCLQIDSSRNEIRKGLCSLYAISLRTDDLKALLLQMKPLITQNEDNAYLYSEYARQLKARGHFIEAMAIYQTIADMFPDLAGVRCDMAGEYFYTGKPNDALRYLDSALSKPDIDPTSFINSAAIYSMLGYYDNALKTFERYSAHDTLLMGDFYKGLIMFSKMDSGYYRQFIHFLGNANQQAYFEEMQLAQKLLPYGKAKLSFEDYKALAANKAIPDYYKVLIYQRGMQQFKDSCLPFIQYGDFQCRFKNFDMAVQFLEEGSHCKIDSTQTEDWLLHYAYALFRSSDKSKSLDYFAGLFASKDAFKWQAAEYFSAKLLVLGGKIPEAQKFLTDVKSSLALSKYRWLANNYAVIPAK